MSKVINLPEGARVSPHVNAPKCPACGRARAVPFYQPHAQKLSYACGADPSWPGCGKIFDAEDAARAAKKR